MSRPGISRKKQPAPDARGVVERRAERPSLGVPRSEVVGEPLHDRRTRVAVPGQQVAKRPPGNANLAADAYKVAPVDVQLLADILGEVHETILAQSYQLRKHQRANGFTDHSLVGAAQNFAENVAKIIERRDLSVNGAATSWKLPTKTLEAIIKRHRTPSLDTAERIAEAAGYLLWQMLSRDFDPDNPPVMRAVSGAGAELYEKLKQLAVAIKQRP